MNEVFRHVANTSETALLYSLIACGFYFASIATRHFCFGAAASFVIAPYSVLSVTGGVAWIIAGLLGLGICAVAGMLYLRVSILLSTRGAREGQLLIFSLATMALAENLVTAFFGSASKTLWIDLDSTGTIIIARQQLVVVILGAAFVLAIVVIWRAALIGKIVQALIESRLNLALRGLPIRIIEQLLASTGFVCLGISGLLWSMDGRVKPAMVVEVAVVGAVTHIIGTMFNSGVLGVILAAVGLAVVRLVLSLTLEGDWSMTAMLLLLGLALVVRGRQSVQIGTTI
jgi:branched-subunit amino acid ABC-type transport system permease component